MDRTWVAMCTRRIVVVAVSSSRVFIICQLVQRSPPSVSIQNWQDRVFKFLWFFFFFILLADFYIGLQTQHTTLVTQHNSCGRPAVSNRIGRRSDDHDSAGPALSWSSDRRPIRFVDSIRIRILTADSIRDSIRTQTADSQVPNNHSLVDTHQTVRLLPSEACIRQCSLAHFCHCMRTYITREAHM